MRGIPGRSIPFLLLISLLATAPPLKAAAAPAIAHPASTSQDASPEQPQETPVPQAQAALVEQTGVALDRLEAIQDTLTVIIALIEQGMPVGERDLLRLETRPMENESRALIEEVADLIRLTEDAGLSSAESRARLGTLLQWFSDAYTGALQLSFAELSALAVAQDSSTAGDLADLAAPGIELRARILSQGLGEVTVLDQAQAVGFDVTAEFAAFDATLLERTDVLVGRLQLRVLARDREETAFAEAQSAEIGAEAIEEARRRVLDATERVEGASSTLEVVSDLLEARGYPTAEYRQLVIEATGEVTGDLFNPRVLLGLARGWIGDGVRWVRDQGPTILARLSLVFLIVWGFRLVFRLGWWLLRVLGVLKMPRLASDLLGRTLKPIATVLGLLVGLWTVGVDSTALLTGLGVFSLIVGLALQDSLSNLAAGLFILAHRPYDVDDVIETGSLLGRVVALGLANTTLLTFDNRKVFVPNRILWGDVIANRSAEPTRRVDVTVEVADNEDLDRVFTVLHTLLDEHELVLAEPESLVFMRGREESWRRLEVRPWVKTEHWWDLKSTLPALIDERFTREGIRAPAPRREVFHAPGGGGAVESTSAAPD